MSIFNPTPIGGDLPVLVNIDALRNHMPRHLKNGMAVIVSSQIVPGDRNGGIFVWDDSSTAADDGLTVIKPATSIAGGRWIQSVGRGTIGPVGPKGDRGFKGDQGEGLATVMAPGGSSLVGFKNDGLNAVTRTVASKLADLKSLRDYGAKGDGLVDDTAAIQAALDANWLNGTLDGGNLTYRITAPLRVTRGSRHSGLQNAVFVIGDHSFLTDKVHPTIPALTSIQFFKLDRVFVDAQAHTVVGRRIIDFTRFTRSKFSNLFLYGKDGLSISLYGTGVDGVSPYYNTFDNIEAANSHIGIQFDDYSGVLDGGCNSNTVTRLRTQPKLGHFGVYIGNGSQNISIVDCALECPSGGTGIYNNGEATRISGNRFESLSTAITWAGGAECGFADGNYYSSNANNHQFFGNASTRNTVMNETGAFAVYGQQATRIAGSVAMGSASFGQSPLKHYEEGAFTPILQASADNGTTSYSAQIGQFTRIGRLVFVEGYIAWSATSADGFPRIGGLPFPAFAVANLYPPITITPENITYSGKIEGVVFSNANYIGLFYSSTDNALSPAALDGSGGIRFAGFYMA